MPPTASATLAATPGSGTRRVTSAIAGSIVSVMTTTFATVPIPGRCRSGIQASRASTLSDPTTTPNGSPVRRTTPWCSTSHGIPPWPAWISIAIDSA